MCPALNRDEPPGFNLMDQLANVLVHQAHALPESIVERRSAPLHQKTACARARTVRHYGLPSKTLDDPAWEILGGSPRRPGCDATKGSG